MEKAESTLLLQPKYIKLAGLVNPEKGYNCSSLLSQHVSYVQIQNIQECVS